MSSGADWGDVVATATLKAVWKGELMVSRTPRMMVWWQAFQHVSGGLDVLHVGAIGRGDEDNAEIQELTRSLLGGLVDMAWKSVGGVLTLEVTPLAWNAGSWGGKVIVRAYEGKQFDPLMIAIQKLKETKR